MLLFGPEKSLDSGPNSDGYVWLWFRLCFRMRQTSESGNCYSGVTSWAIGRGTWTLMHSEITKILWFLTSKFLTVTYYFNNPSSTAYTPYVLWNPVGLTSRHHVLSGASIPLKQWHKIFPREKSHNCSYSKLLKNSHIPPSYQLKVVPPSFKVTHLRRQCTGIDAPCVLHLKIYETFISTVFRRNGSEETSSWSLYLGPQLSW